MQCSRLVENTRDLKYRRKNVNILDKHLKSTLAIKVCEQTTYMPIPTANTRTQIHFLSPDTAEG